MGIKKFFKIKPPPEATVEENRDYLNELGIATKQDSTKRREKFAAYGKFANDRVRTKVYAPEGYAQYANPDTEPSDKADMDDLNKSPYDQVSMVNNRNTSAGVSNSSPYGNNYGAGNYVDPYSNSGPSPYGTNQYSQSSTNTPASDPYGSANTNTNTRYNDSSRQGYGNSYGNIYENTSTPANAYSTSALPNSNSYKSSGRAPSGNPYASVNATDPYISNSRSTSANAYGSTSSTPVPPRSSSSKGRGSAAQKEFDFERNKEDDDLDLNDTISQDKFGSGRGEDFDDLNHSIHENQRIGAGVSGAGGEPKGYQTFEDLQKQQQQQEQAEEDEEVDSIKQQIKFTKQSSVASTRNTLKMAQDAELAGMNTLGMLGHQSEKLNGVERNLNLMQIQNRVADDKVAELKKLNRNILAVHVSNPFNSKRRARETEEKIKTQRRLDKQAQQDLSSQLSQSTRRIEGVLSTDNGASEVRDRYQRQQVLEKSKRYQFENDEEDDEMELEIDRNLDKIGQISGRLKKLAIATGKEIDSQQERIQNIEENADDLDIKIHVNTTKLSNIR